MKNRQDRQDRFSRGARFSRSSRRARYSRILLLAACCLASCADDDGGSGSLGTDEIAFTTSIGDDLETRAGEDKSLNDYGYAELGVWGMKYNGTSPQPVMPNYRVQYDASKYNYQSTLEHWGYDHLLNISDETQYLKYWDDELPYYQFVGYAPYATGKMTEDPTTGKKISKHMYGDNLTTRYNNTTISASDHVLAFYNFLNGNIQYSASNDFILAHGSRDGSSSTTASANYDILDKTTMTSTPFHGNVAMAFNRLTCVVEFKIYQAAPTTGWTDPGISTSNFSYTAANITINNFYDKADVYESFAKTVTNEAIKWDGYANTYRTCVEFDSKIDITGDDPLTPFGSNLVQKADIPIDNGSYTYTATITPKGGIIQLPQSGVNLVASVTVPTSDAESTWTKTVTISDQTWEANKRYVYYLIYPWRTSEAIKVVLKEIAWSSGGSQEIEETDW